MRVLVTGADGFVGGYLWRELLAHGHEPVGLTLPSRSECRKGDRVDIRRRKQVEAAVEKIRPRACVHLAALSYVPEGERNPVNMLRVNVAGTVHLLDALAQYAPKARCLIVSTAHVYGGNQTSADVLAEDAPLRPESMYAVSKAAAELAALGRARGSGLEIMIARPVNHTGPGQSSRFVVPGMVEQALAFREGKRDSMELGNLESTRDFLDVRDVARAYRLLLEHARSGAAYNIASGRLRSIRVLLETICSEVGVAPDIRRDDSKFREADHAPRLDWSQIRSDTGWSPEFGLSETIADMLRAVSG